MFVVSCLVVVTAILVPLFISLGPSFVVHQSGVVLVTGELVFLNNTFFLILLCAVGASSGIGRHAAFSIAARGYTVFAGCRKAVDQLELQHEAARLKVDLRPILLDVTDRATISASLLHISAVLRETNAPLVGVVNNAGISDKQTIEGASDETFQRVLDVNVLGVQRMVAAFGPLLRQHKGIAIFCVDVSLTKRFGRTSGQHRFVGRRNRNAAFRHVCCQQGCTQDADRSVEIGGETCFFVFFCFLLRLLLVHSSF